MAYEGALRSLGIGDIPVIGQSFGGMLAAELAVTFPGLFSRVVLLAPNWRIVAAIRADRDAR